MTYSLIQSEVKDHPWLDALRREVYKDLFDLTWGRWDEARHQRHFSACLDRGAIQIIKVADSPVGMLQLLESEVAIEIGEIQILPAYQRQGLGTKILTDVIHHAQKHAKPLKLSTGLRNVGALELYKKLGFREIERSETHVHMVHFTV
ncbi:GNAT family N-acetyltransferase [Flavilitoribacter nigricans]|uniref:N-acetyltransferase domain-containing protein n=1 Tax=Flavilitoribacter nigricans (strain ATCC 23147 / DSM 23189 / NBRC 102662 / NCIMB 1420 / SS-2) TaxID=1122177 RepID=A0A2D0N1C2_FLAN2|nr:GNAT family N-acetyltransferase [Flavilitoribacter nigricans]PHN02178.1 hypothetical protein CRP01_33115 [Flavilitoribacter nigricans DSM 23189 = NBRC 102662]